MFGINKKSQSTELEVSRPIELVKKYGMVLQQEAFQTEQMQHLDRLLDTIAAPHKDFVSVCLKLERKQYIEAGFHYFVTPSFAQHFRFHAQIGNRGIYEENETVVGHNWWNAWTEVYSPVVYVGDVPEVALDKIALAKRLTQYLSIHSNESLPVSFFHLRAIDPVIIGWARNPRFYYPEEGGKIRSFNKVDEENFGVVVAIWNNQNELEL